MTNEQWMENISKKIKNIEYRLSLLELNFSRENTKQSLNDELVNIKVDLKQVTRENENNQIKNTTINTEEKTDDIEKEKINIKNSIEKLRDCKTYKKQLNGIKQHRKSLIKKLGIEKYTELCNDNIKQVTGIFTDKGFKGKKLENIIQKSLNSLDSRLTKYGKYYENCIDIDEINILKETLNLWRKERKHYEIFNFTELCENLNNYGLIISTIDEIIKTNLVDKKGFNNIIYRNIIPESKNPYSFYVLDKINGLKKYWKMDCRLEQFSIQFRDYLIEYLIRIFRNMYCDVFSDNDYRTDYKSHCQFTECDMGLLYNNILILGDFRILNNLIKKIIKLNCSYNPDENDIFNITKDDPLKDNDYCKKLHITESEIHKQLFDK